jgi:hypothetical protein
LYKLPAETLAVLRKEMNLPVTLECCGRVSLFLYDNETFILQSFLDRPEKIRLRVNKPKALLVPLTKAPPPENVASSDKGSIFELVLLPGHYAVFKF